MNNEKKDGTLTEITVFINAHKAVYEKWPHGEPTSVRKNDGNIVEIQYEDGSWYHYRKTENGIEWW